MQQPSSAFLPIIGIPGPEITPSTYLRLEFSDEYAAEVSPYSRRCLRDGCSVLTEVWGIILAEVSAHFNFPASGIAISFFFVPNVTFFLTR
jgi:hypothetical protein